MEAETHARSRIGNNVRPVRLLLVVQSPVSKSTQNLIRYQVDVDVPLDCVFSHSCSVFGVHW